MQSTRANRENLYDSREIVHAFITLYVHAQQSVEYHFQFSIKSLIILVPTRSFERRPPDYLYASPLKKNFQIILSLSLSPSIKQRKNSTLLPGPRENVRNSAPRINYFKNA